MAAGSIVVDLLARTGSFVTDIDRSTKAAEKRLKEFKAAAVAAGQAIGAGLAAAGVAAVYFGKQVVDGLDALNDVADATGASIENISALEDVALRTGASLDTVSTSLIKFNQVLSKADDNAISDALEAIGLNVKELKALDPAEALRQTAVALSQYANDANKARLVQELFGKSIAEVAPFLNDLAEQTELQGKVTKEAAADAEQFNKNLSQASATVNQLARDIVGPLIKALNEVTQAFKDGTAAGKGFFEIGWDRYTGNVRKFYEDIGLLNKAVQAGGGGGSGASGSPTSFVGPEAPAPSLPDTEKLKAEREANKKAAEEAKKAAKERETAAKKAQDDANRYIDQLNQQIARTQELTEVEKVLDDIANKRISFSTNALAGEAIARAQRLDDIKAQEESEKSATESAKRLADAQRQIANEVAALNQATQSPQEEFAARVERLNELLDNGRITLLEYTRGLELYKEQLADATDKTDKSIDQMSKFAQRAAENIQDALGDTLEQTLSGNFDSIGQMWTKLLQKMLAQALATQLNEALFGSVGANGQRSGGVNWGSLFSAVGSAFGGSTATPMATGTNYVPYDNFPAMLHEGEAVIPKKYNPAAGGSGIGGQTIDFGTTYVGSNVSLPEVDELIRRRNQEMLARLQRSQRQQTLV